MVWTGSWLQSELLELKVILGRYEKSLPGCNFITKRNPEITLFFPHRSLIGEISGPLAETKWLVDELLEMTHGRLEYSR